MAVSLTELKRKKGLLVAQMKALVDKEDALDDGAVLPDADKTTFEDVKTELAALNERIGRVEDVLSAQADAADVIPDDTEEPDPEGGDAPVGDTVATGHAAGRRRAAGYRAPAQVEPVIKLEKGSFVAACAKMMAFARSPLALRETSVAMYGENHPVTRALTVKTLVAGVGPNGGFVVPPDYVRELIELLRAQCVVRASGPRTMPMPNGTLTMPKQTQAASASYVGEVTPIPVSQEAFGQITASYKTLAAMVPVSNDLMRYSDPAMDAFVRDDLVQVMARAEDLAFIRSDGTQGTPKGMRTFCQPGNVVTSSPAFGYQSAAQELGAAINKLETGNVQMVNPVWLMNPRAKNYLLNVQNQVGAFVFREEMNGSKTINGVPFRTTTQIPANLAFTSGGIVYTDGTEIYLVEMTQALLLDSETLELSAATEASYVDANGQLQNAYQQRQTLIRAVSQHDFQMRHDEAVVMITNVRWAPAIQ